MANEEVNNKPLEQRQMPDQEGITITLDNPVFFENIASFYMKRQFSDIIINNNSQKIYAHKIVLTARCKYFEDLFADNPYQCAIVINDASFEAFEKVLKFIYTGSITFPPTETELIFEIMQLAAKYFLKDLEKAISEKIACTINMDTVFTLLNKANEHELEELINMCHKFMDKRCLEILKNANIINLTQQSMVKLMERDSFGAPEIEIFKSIAKWCKKNTDVDNLVINCVRLSCLTNDEILSTVYPSKLIEDHKLLAILSKNTMKEKSKSSQTIFLSNEYDSEYRVKDKNLATPEHAEVISGLNTDFLLKKNKGKSHNTAFHYIKNKKGITVRLDSPQYVNRLYMRLRDENLRFYSYYIAVSSDEKKWRKIINYSNCHCRSFQNLYFEEEFHLMFFRTYLSSFTPEVSTDGVVYPVENVASSGKGAVVIQGRNPENLLMQNSNNFTASYYDSYTTHSAVVIQLAQPYMISSMKFLLPNNGCKYDYSVETSIDKCNWSVAVKPENGEGYYSWQNLHFAERAVVYIKIIDNLVVYHRYVPPSMRGLSSLKCACLECPSFKEKTVIQ